MPAPPGLNTSPMRNFECTGCDKLFISQEECRHHQLSTHHLWGTHWVPSQLMWYHLWIDVQQTLYRPLPIGYQTCVHVPFILSQCLGKKNCFVANWRTLSSLFTSHEDCWHHRLSAHHLWRTHWVPSQLMLYHLWFDLPETLCPLVPFMGEAIEYRALHTFHNIIVFTEVFTLWLIWNTLSALPVLKLAVY